jgi:hypothetical protein
VIENKEYILMVGNLSKDHKDKTLSDSRCRDITTESLAWGSEFTLW